jgi:3-hydroxy-3-methylglutaryl CoA synthase
MVVDGVEDLHDRLDSRRRITPDEFIDYIERREKFGYSSPFRPRDRPDKLRPGTWYLESIDSMHRRMYKQHGKVTLFFIYFLFFTSRYSY